MQANLSCSRDLADRTRRAKLGQRRMRPNGVDQGPVSETEILNQAVQRIQARWNPARIVLFGSRAKGTARPTSDFDLLVVMDDAGDWRRPGEILAALFDLPASFDVLVESTASWEKWRRVKPAIQATIDREGRTIFDAGR